jgi:Flp pilus assembly protein TadD
LRPDNIKQGWRLWAKRSALLAFGSAITIAPVTLRNLITGSDAVLISSSGGVNFYLGNARESDGRFISLNQLPLAPGRFDDDPSRGRFERSIHSYAEEKTGRGLRPSEVSSFWAELARREIGSDFWGWIKLLTRKGFLFFNAYEIPQIDNLYFLSGYLPVLKGPLSMVSRMLWPLALFGFLALLFRKGEPKTPPWIFSGYALSVILFFVTARHRLPVVPIAAGLAGFGAAYFVGIFRERHPRRLFFALLFAGCFLFSNLNPALGQRPVIGRQIDREWFGIDEDYLDFASQHNNMAATLLEKGSRAEAERECREGLKLKPYHPTLLYNLGRALELKGDLAGAKQAMEQSLAVAPENPVVSAHLGEINYKFNDFAGARKALESALKAAPQMANAWNSLGPARFRLGDTVGALAALVRAEELAPNWTQPRYNRGIMLIRSKRHEEAAALFDSLWQLEPENRPVLSAYTESLVGLAERHLSGGEKGLARAAALRVLSLNPNQRRAREILEELAP